VSTPGHCIFCKGSPHKQKLIEEHDSKEGRKNTQQFDAEAKKENERVSSFNSEKNQFQVRAHSGSRNAKRSELSHPLLFSFSSEDVISLVETDYEGSNNDAQCFVCVMNFSEDKHGVI
jgi:hypothetical protein